MANGFGSLIMDQSPDEEAMMPETFRSPLGKVAVGVPAMTAKSLLWDLPKSLITAATSNPMPGLRREDYTDIPDAPQPGADLIARSADTAMNALGTAAPFAKPGSLGALGGKAKTSGAAPKDLASPFDDVVAKYPQLKIDVSPARSPDGYGVLSRIEVPKELRGAGIGTQAMQDLVAAADKSGMKLALTPSKNFGGAIPRLNEFYQRFGFVPNKGKSKDFTTRETMIREAKEPPDQYASWQDAIDNKPQHFAGMLGEDDGKDPTPGAFTQYPGFRQSVDVEDRRNETPASRESTKFPVVPDTEDLSTTALASDLGINDIERAALNEKFKRAVSQAQGSKAKK